MGKLAVELRLHLVSSSPMFLLEQCLHLQLKGSETNQLFYVQLSCFTFFENIFFGLYIHISTTSQVHCHLSSIENLATFWESTYDRSHYLGLGDFNRLLNGVDKFCKRKWNMLPSVSIIFVTTIFYGFVLLQISRLTFH